MRNLKLILMCFLILAPAAAAEESAEYLHREAERLIATQRFDEALKLYEEAALNVADNDEAYAKIGSIYKIRGQTRKAIEAYESALSINPDNEEALDNILELKNPDGRTSSEILSD